MPTAEDQGRQFTLDQKLSIAVLIVNVVALLVGLSAYLWPSDAAHPPHFDFLARTVSLPVWQVVIIPTALVGVALALARLRRQTTKLVLLPQPAPPSGPAATQYLPTASGARAADSAPAQCTAVASDKTELTIPSPDDVLIHIRRYEATNIKGLVINVDNNRLDPISGIAFTIRSAQSFDEYHNAFRSSSNFDAAVMAQPTTVQPRCSSNPTLLVRKDLSNPHLLASDDSSHLLIWPDNDPSQFQKWCIDLAFIAHRVGSGRRGSIPLTVVRHDVILTWDKSTNEFYVELA